MSGLAAKAVSATEADLDALRALLASHGIEVSRASLAARLADDDAGVLLCGAASLSWVLDAGALHLYDIVAAPSEGAALDALLAGATSLARARFTAVLVATLYDDAPLVPALLARSFVVDARELEARGDAVVALLTLVRDVT